MSDTSPLRMHPADLVSAETFARLRQRSDLWGGLLIAHAWAIILGAMALFAWSPNPVTFILAVMLIGSRQLGLAILTHDAAHHALMTTPTRNYFWSDWLCAFPVLNATRAYRQYHLRHHAHTQQEDDPDLILSAPFPITRKSLVRKIFRDLSGQTGISQRYAQFKSALGNHTMSSSMRRAHFWQKLGGGLITQVVIFGFCAVVFDWYYYLIFWLLPLVTWHMLVVRIRNIAEHAMVPDDNDPFRNARTTLAGPLTRLFLAPYWVNYHVEHHLLMYLPCYRLPLLHAALVAEGVDSRMEIDKNYWQVLRKITTFSSTRDWTDSSSRRARRKTGDFSEGYKTRGS